MSTGFIYGLVGPDGLRYVGQTRRRLRDRYRAHERDMERGSQLRVHRWWRKLEKGPEIVVLEECEAERLDEREIAWISELRASGHRLCNHKDGGARGVPDEESRARMSAAQRGRKATPETKEKLSASRRGRAFSSEHRARISQGLRQSEKAKRKRKAIAAAQIGAKRSPEARERMAAAQRRRYDRMTEAERKALTAAANTAWRARVA